MLPAFSALAIYTGLLGLIGFWLQTNAIRKKQSAGVSIGDGGDPGALRAIRGHLNFIENAPMGLLILLFAALLNAPVWLIHIGGVLLVIGRFLHAWHFIQADAPAWQRGIGMLFSILVIVGGSLGLIGFGILSLI